MLMLLQQYSQFPEPTLLAIAEKIFSGGLLPDPTTRVPGHVHFLQDAFFSYILSQPLFN
jgi:hypothetical protein